MRIGLDLDNTLICYDRAFAEVGRAEGLLPRSFDGDKAAVKQALIGQRPDGYLWERLQGLVYGREIAAATLFDGAADFLAACRGRDERISIVSHKTLRAHHDPSATDLRAAALSWMERQGFFDAAGLGLDRAQVFFEDTRRDKVRRIAALGCELFVDDLAEVLEHEDMPAACRKILLGREPRAGLEHYASWREIRHAVFPAA